MLEDCTKEGCHSCHCKFSRPSSLLVAYKLLRNLEGILIGGELEDFDA